MAFSWLPCCPARETYMVRWDFVTIRPEFVKLKKGAEVYVLSWEEKQQFYTQKTPCVQNVNSRGQRGLISPHFILKKSDLLLDERERDPIARGYWYVGDIGPVEASMRLRSSSEWCKAGAFVVCSPPEYASTEQWPPLLLLIRTYSETEDNFYSWWKSKIGDHRQPPPKDRLTGPRAPMPIVAYVRIRRNKDGRYFIYTEKKMCLCDTLPELISHYFNAKEPIVVDMDMQPQMVNTIPAPIRDKKNIRKNFFEIDLPAPPCIYARPPPGFGVEKSGRNPLMLLPKGAKYTLDVSKNVENGKFGTVAKGDLRYQNQSYTVAVKTITDPSGLCVAAFDYLRGDHARTFAGGNYLLKFYAMKTDEDPPQTLRLIMEWMSLGALDIYLRKRKEDDKQLPFRGLIEIIYQVVCGLRYLHEHEMRHRKLSIGNVLVETESRNSLCVKVGDYYVASAQLDDLRFFDKQDAMDLLEWRCMAIESLKRHKFTIPSDIWMLGVLIYQVLSHGQNIHQNINEPKDLIQFIDNGGQLPRLDSMPQYIFNYLCVSCWNLEPKQRPQLDEMFHFLNSLLFDAVEGCAHAILKMDRAPGESGGGTTTKSYSKRKQSTKSKSTGEKKTAATDE